MTRRLPEPAGSDEFQIDASLVGRLIARQFPRWARLRLARVPSAGTDNAMYRLGENLVVRLPRVPSAVHGIAVEQRWLPRLSPLLPLAIPAPAACGEPDGEFPHPWSVYRWLDGRDSVTHPVVHQRDAALTLGHFVAALRRIDPTGGPPSFRGDPIGGRDRDVRATIRALDGKVLVDGQLATAVWETALAAPSWEGPPVWLHADLHPANLITRRGRLVAVIDFGGLGVGLTPTPRATPLSELPLHGVRVPRRQSTAERSQVLICAAHSLRRKHAKPHRVARRGCVEKYCS